MLTTHYLERAENLCKEVIMIDKGKSAYKREQSKELLRNMNLKSINIHIENEINELSKELKNLDFILINRKCLSLDYKPSKTSIERVLNIILKNNITIKDIITNEPSLEDLFNNLVK